MEKIKEEIQNAQKTFENLMSLQSQQKIYFTYNFNINFDNFTMSNNFNILGETNSELEKELFTNKIKEFNSDNIYNELKFIKENPFDYTIKCQDLKKNPVSISLNNDKINIIYVFCLYIKENDKYFNNVIKILEENKEKWKDKIRFIAIHFHEIEEKKLEWVFKKNLDFFEIYYLDNGVMDEFPRHFNINHVPFIFMIDKENKMKFKNYETNLYFKFNTGIDNIIEGRNFEINIQKQTEDEDLKKEKEIIFENIFSSLEIFEKIKTEDLKTLNSLTMRGSYIFHYDVRKIERKKITLFTKFLNLNNKNFVNNFLKDLKWEYEEEIDEIYFSCEYEIKGKKIISDKKEEKCVICRNNFILNENNFYCCFACNFKKKQIYICENCIKTEKNCLENPIHEHPILFVPKNGVELIREKNNLYCEVEEADYYDLNEICVYCDKDINDFCWECVECNFYLCNSCFKKSLEDENFSLDNHEKEHSFYRCMKNWRMYQKPDEISVIENDSY